MKNIKKKKRLDSISSKIIKNAMGRILPNGAYGRCGECHKIIETEKEYESTNGLCKNCYKKAQERLKKEMESHYRRMIKGLPEEYLKFWWKPAHKDMHKSMFIYGETNTGKTIHATSILRYRWKIGLPGKFINFPELVDNLRHNYRDYHYTMMNVINCEGCLVLDEFGGVVETNEHTIKVANIISNHRSAKKLQTIYTSNWSPEEIAELLDPRVASRIVRLCRSDNIIRKTKVYDIGE